MFEHSANGREKRNKEVASQEVRNILVCKGCGNKMPDKSKEFGEKNSCVNCGSTELTYETTQ